MEIDLNLTTVGTALLVLGTSVFIERTSFACCQIPKAPSIVAARLFAVGIANKPGTLTGAPARLRIQHQRT